MTSKLPSESAAAALLPRHGRLRRQADFQRVYASGVRVRGQWLLIVAAPWAGPKGTPEEARLGLSVGRKYSKSAVLRNRLRRLLREAFRLERHRFPALDCIAIPLAGRSGFDLDGLRDDLVTLVAKAESKISCANS